jgi:hypothetical protein
MPCSLCSATRGVVWGPIRLPPAMRRAARHAAESRWDWSLILHQRHPLDTLVSKFHSFDWVHPLAPEATAGQRREHERRQERIRNVSGDAYVATGLAGLRDRCSPLSPVAVAQRGCATGALLPSPMGLSELRDECPSPPLPLYRLPT